MAMVAKNTKTKVVNDTNLKVSGSSLVKLTQTDDFGKVFNAPANPALLAQYLRVYYSNQRKGNAKTKNRGEVAGSGKKPWRQKGTGRARVGSIRNPAWRHGGVSHGPVPKDWSLNFPKKMSSKAMFVALSQKLLAGKLYTVDSLDLSEGRTRELVNLLASWKLRSSVLLVTEKALPHLRFASANLKHVLTVTWSNLNIYQLLAQTNAIFEKTALEKLKEKYAKNN